MKRRKKVNRPYILYFLLITLLITIGYSSVDTLLSINGNISASSSIYNISWNNIQTTTGSITPTTNPTITNGKTEVNYSLTFTNPGDFYEFSLDSINNGSNDAMIESIISKVNNQDITNLPSILEYTVTYSDGAEIELKDYLKKGNDSKETITIKVKVKDNATSSQISSLNQPINFTFSIDYVKADSTAKEVIHGMHCTYDGELTQGASYSNGDYIYSYKQEYNYIDGWTNINDDGWGVVVTDELEDNNVDSPLCVTINNKPIVSMSYMFADSEAETIDFSSYNTTNVKNMKGMFYNSVLTELDLSNFDTSNVENMSKMFYRADYLTELDLSNFNTSKVTNMSSMFFNTELESINLSSFDTSNVTDMSYMFYYNEDLTSINITNFDTSNVTTMKGMFSYLTTIDIDTTSFNTSNVTDMSEMYKGAKASVLILSNFDTSKVTTMEDMFAYTSSMLSLESFNTSNVTTMARMFQNYGGSSIDISSFNTSNVTNMISMFEQCTSLYNIYVGSGWSVANVTNANSTNMFLNDTHLPHYSRYYTNKTRANTSYNGYLTLKS